MGEAKRRKENSPNYGQADKRAVDISNLPPGTTSNEYLNYLDQNWDELGIFAYGSYLDQGRGILILDWDLSLDSQLSLLSPDLRAMNSSSRAGTQQVNCPILYAGVQGNLLPAFLKGRDIASWNRLIQNYKPESMIVLALCWGFHPGMTGNIMARSIFTLPNHKPPAQLYVENGDRLSEFGFWKNTNEAIPTGGNRLIREFRVALESDVAFRQQLQICFREGLKQSNKGAVLALPKREGMQIVFVPEADLGGALGADIQSRACQQALAIVQSCDPERQVAVIAIDRDLTASAEFLYYSFLFRTGDEEGSS